MAADIENELSERAELVQSSGGVFEVEDGGQLIFSKSALGRFPIDSEVLEIIKLKANGMELAQAQAKAHEALQKPVSLVTWFKSFGAKNT